MADLAAQFTEMVRNYSDLHRFESKTVTGLERCHGCSWIGWSHAQHHAEVIGEALAAVVDTAADEFFRSTP